MDYLGLPAESVTAIVMSGIGGAAWVGRQVVGSCTAIMAKRADIQHIQDLAAIELQKAKEEALLTERREAITTQGRVVMEMTAEIKATRVEMLGLVREMVTLNTEARAELHDHTEGSKIVYHKLEEVLVKLNDNDAKLVDNDAKLDMVIKKFEQYDRLTAFAASLAVPTPANT